MGGKSLIFSNFNDTFFLLFEQGPHVFILHWAPQITWLTLHASMGFDRQNHKLVQF